jgi:hypothetical protein
MKTINKKILIFLGDIILKYNLEKDIIDESYNSIDNSDKLEKTLALIFNDKVNGKVNNGERMEDFNPLIRLRLIIDDLINNQISYENLPKIIKEKLGVSDEEANSIYLSIKENKEIEKIRCNDFVKEDLDQKRENKEEKLEKKSIGYELLK